MVFGYGNSSLIVFIDNSGCSSVHSRSDNRRLIHTHFWLKRRFYKHHLVITCVIWLFLYLLFGNKNILTEETLPTFYQQLLYKMFFYVSTFETWITLVPFVQFCSDYFQNAPKSSGFRVTAFQETYSASVVERKTQVCFLLLHVIAPPDRMKEYPEVVRRSLRSPTQSASE